MLLDLSCCPCARSSVCWPLVAPDLSSAAFLFISRPECSSFVAPEDLSSADVPDFMLLEAPAWPTVPFSWADSLPIEPPRSAAPPEGCECCVCAPPAPPPLSRFMVPCAFARPVPATSASVATEIIKRLDMEFSSRVHLRHCPRRQRKEI